MAKRHLHVLMNEARVAMGRANVSDNPSMTPSRMSLFGHKNLWSCGGPELLQTQKKRAIQIPSGELT